MAERYEQLNQLDQAEDAWFMANKNAKPAFREIKVAIADFYKRCHDNATEEFFLRRALSITTPTQGYHRSNTAWDGSLEARLEKLKGPPIE
jgi:hypothetical protein